MTNLKKNIPINNLTKHMVCEVKITGMKVMEIKIKLAIVLFRIATWVIGMQFKVFLNDTLLCETVTYDVKEKCLI